MTNQVTEPNLTQHVSEDRRERDRLLVLATLEVLVGPEGAVAVMAAVGLDPWVTFGDLTEAETVALRLEVVRRCAVAPAGDDEFER